MLTDFLIKKHLIHLITWKEIHAFVFSLHPSWFINKPDSSRDLIVSKISFISAFEIIIAVVSHSKILFCIAASVADAAVVYPNDVGAVNPNGIKTFVPNVLSIFFIKGKPVFSNGCKSLPKSFLDYLFLDNWVFGTYILVDELFAKALWSFETCLLVNINLCGKLVSSLEIPTTFDERFKVTSLQVFSPDFNLLRCKLDNFMFKVLY